MKLFFISVLAGCLVAGTGCRDSSQAKADDHGAHGPPHGGTPVMVGSHHYHLELVRDPATGLMHAYVLDAHLHDFVRVLETNFVLLANMAGTTERLDFVRVTNSTTPNLSEPSFLFEARS